jgi:hypothetical protein
MRQVLRPVCGVVMKKFTVGLEFSECPFEGKPVLVPLLVIHRIKVEFYRSVPNAWIGLATFL